MTMACIHRALLPPKQQVSRDLSPLEESKVSTGGSVPVATQRCVRWCGGARAMTSSLTRRPSSPGKRERERERACGRTWKWNDSKINRWAMKANWGDNRNKRSPETSISGCLITWICKHLDPKDNGPAKTLDLLSKNTQPMSLREDILTRSQSSEKT